MAIGRKIAAEIGLCPDCLGGGCWKCKHTGKLRRAAARVAEPVCGRCLGSGRHAHLPWAPCRECSAP